MSRNPTRQEIADDWELWCEYVDPQGIGTEEEFQAMTNAEKLGVQSDCFGDE